MNSAELDKRYIWHPFTQMKEWTASSNTPVVIVGGQGAELIDEEGNRYLDGNSSIWTNLHGHRHPLLDAAFTRQLGRIAHCSFLGLTNDVAPRLGAQLLEAARLKGRGHRVFFSDDGSTAVEAGLKMAIQARRQRGEKQRQRFLSLAGGYHGDTVGAMSLGHSLLFHRHYRSVMFSTQEVMAPACYRCPHNRAPWEPGYDARETRRCCWECLGALERILKKWGRRLAAFVAEPLVQGAAGMLMHPHGYLQQAAHLCRQHGVWLMLDEVLTGFGRTGSLFAFQKEGVIPDVVALAKGLTGGYLPLAATLASREIYEAFLGEYAEFKTFFHGHSYTGNPLGCAVAMASLELLKKEHSWRRMAAKAATLGRLARVFWEHPYVGDVRQEGMILAVELVKDRPRRQPFPLAQRHGYRVCEAARRRGLLTRPVGDVLVLMPPYCASVQQLEKMTCALWEGLNEVLPIPRRSRVQRVQAAQPPGLRKQPSSAEIAGGPKTPAPEPWPDSTSTKITTT